MPIARWVREHGGDDAGRRSTPLVERIAREGGTPLVVAERENGGARVLGVDLPQGHREGRHAASASTGSARWASARS